MTAILGTEPALLMHIGGLRFLQPSESHHIFGAGFIFIAALLAGESLAGKVWHRNQIRSLMFPAILILLGWGMISVTAVEPRARFVHVAMGIPMIAGGWAEARSRLDGFPRRYADTFLVPGLVLAALDTVMFHLAGPATSPAVVTHAGLAIIAICLAAARVYQSGDPGSMYRGLVVSAVVFAVGLDLWVDALYQ